MASPISHVIGLMKNAFKNYQIIVLHAFSPMHLPCMPSPNISGPNDPVQNVVPSWSKPKTLGLAGLAQKIIDPMSRPMHAFIEPGLARPLPILPLLNIGSIKRFEPPHISLWNDRRLLRNRWSNTTTTHNSIMLETSALKSQGWVG